MGFDQNISRSYRPISIKFGRNMKTKSIKTEFDVIKKSVKGQGHRGQITIKMWLFWGFDQDISGSFQPISMKFHRKLQTESLKDKFYIQKNLSKVKVIEIK